MHGPLLIIFYITEGLHCLKIGNEIKNELFVWIISWKQQQHRKFVFCYLDALENKQKKYLFSEIRAFTTLVR